MAMKIKLGATIIENRTAPSVYTTGNTWNIGQILTMSAGVLTCADGDTTGTVGLAMESRQEPTGGDYSKDQTYHGYGSILTGEAVVLTDQVESGITLAAEDKLYVGTNAKLTNVQSNSKKVVGRCRVAADSDGFVEIFWRPAVNDL